VYSIYSIIRKRNPNLITGWNSYIYLNNVFKVNRTNIQAIGENGMS
jgi:hypothetical protein